MKAATALFLSLRLGCLLLGRGITSFVVQPQQPSARLTRQRLIGIRSTCSSPNHRPLQFSPTNAFPSTTTRLQATTFNNSDGDDEYFTFQGHKIYSEIHSPAGTNHNNNHIHVLLIHGFGCSTLYWRDTIRALVQQGGYTVHALDMLGQGKSDKPGRAENIEYSIDLWAQQVEAYAKAKIPMSNSGGIVLIGNSLGSVVALSAATADYKNRQQDDKASYLRQHCKGIGMFNCGIGMNSLNLLYDFTGIQRVFLTAVFAVLNFVIFGNIPLLTYVLDKVVTKDLLRNALTGLYQYADSVEDRVDDALVDSFYYPAKDPGSPEALSQIYTNDPGAPPMEIWKRHQDWFQTQPVLIHLVWGEQDGVTPLQGAVGQFFQTLANDDSNNNNQVSMDVITGGHIPFDEVPESNDLMVQWLNAVFEKESLPQQ